MSVNNISNIGNVSPASPAKPATGGGPEATQVLAGAGERTTVQNQAVLLLVNSLITGELAELAKVIANRTVLIKLLPPDIQEFVQQILNQTTSAEATLPEGLAALLKSPKSVADKLGSLAGALEGTAALVDPAGQPAARPEAKSASLLADGTSVGQGKSQDELQAAVKAFIKSLPPDVQELVREILSQSAAADESLPQELATAKALIKSLPPDIQALLRQIVSQPAAADAPLPQGQVTVQVLIKSLPPDIQALLRQILSQSAAADESLPQELATAKALIKSLPSDIQALLRQIVSQSAAVEAPLPQGLATTQALIKSLPPEMQALLRKILSQSALADETLPQGQVTAQAVIKSLPSEMQAFLKQILSQSALADEPLPQGLAALLRSPKSAADKLSSLAGVLEEIAVVVGRESQSKAKQPAILAAIINAWQGNSPDELKAAAKVVRELAETVQRPAGLVAERQENRSVLTFAMPLYFGEGGQAYPAHIHIYHQQEQDKKNPGQVKTETWLRICLETENIGVVETAFRLYDDCHLDVKVKFADGLAADDFQTDLREIRQQLGELPLELGEFLVR